jgi:hypothetical protein
MKIVLQSNDNEEFEVDRDVIRLSTTLNTMFQVCTKFLNLNPSFLGLGHG